MEIGQPYMTQLPKIKHNNISVELSIQLGLDGHSFLIREQFSNKPIFRFQESFSETASPLELLEKLKNTLASQCPQDVDYSKVRLAIVNSLSSLVPLPLFDEHALKGYLNLNTQLLENDYVTYDVLQNHDLVNVYVPFVNLNNFLFDQFGSFEYYHFSTVLLEQLFIKAANKKEAQWFVHVQEKSLEIVVIKDKKLLFYNTFGYQTPEDFLYYLLFVAEQCDLNPDSDKLELIGKIEPNDALHKLTHQYVRNVVFYQDPIAEESSEVVRSLYSHNDIILNHLF
ncbi:MAG: DUF3822 family protein [Flavobacteriaceae bacterium]|nr:DUF3822 family protein [Flavobacteriaceae bacterium]